VSLAPRAACGSSLTPPSPPVSTISELFMTIDRDALVAFTQALVRVPSVYDPPTERGEEPAARLVADKMREFGWDPQFDEVAPGRPNVIAVLDGGRPGPTLMFEGHTDVVMEGDVESWSVDPFAATIIEGRLYGRGAADMKSGVAAMLFAAKEIADSRPFPGRLLVGALVDEEGMMLGAKHFVASGRLSGVDAVICCEPEAGEICNVSKGALRLRVDVRGRMAHGAMPYAGCNPNPALAAFVGRLSGLERRYQDETGEHPSLGKVFITPTVVQSGDPIQMNVIPEMASVWIDVRTVPGVDHLALVEAVRTEAESAAGESLHTSVEVIDDRPAVETPPDSPVVMALLGAHERVTGEPGRLGGVPGATDGTVLTGRGGVPSVVYGPGGKYIAHQADEYVEVDEIVRCAEVYAEAARRFLGAS
jgi:succinyl-diaminopimelate desuccinylase